MAALGFTPAEIEYQLTHANETNGPKYMAAIGTLSALATISIGLRIWVRIINRNELKSDDYTIFLAFIFTWCEFVANYYRTQNGLGRHLLTITPEMWSRSNMAYFVLQVFYFLAQMFTQISVLLLYKRVFTLYRPWFRIALGVLTFLALTSNLSVLLVIIFGCSPIEKSWKGFAVEGHCVDLRNLYIAHAALSLVVDLSIVVAPIPLVWSLHTNRRTKVAVTGMVLLGSVVSIANPVKIHYFITPLPKDLTYNGISASGIWTHAQLCLGVVGACLPCFKPLFSGFSGILSSLHPSASAPPGGKSARSTKGSAPDQYKSLEGKEPSLTESDIGLVPLQQPPMFPGQSSSGHTKSVVEGGRPRSKDIERGLALDEIGVTRDIDVSSSRAR